MNKKVNELISKTKIKQRTKQIAEDLTNRFKDKMPLVIGVLNGSFMFYSDLVKRLPFDLEVGFIKASSYKDQMQSSGEVEVADGMLDLDSVKGRDLIIVEDIVDTGKTLQELDRFFKNIGANSVTTVSLLDKPARREVDFKPDLVGFEIDDIFVVGYGLDFAQKYRNLPYVGYIEEN